MAALNHASSRSRLIPLLGLSCLILLVACGRQKEEPAAESNVPPLARVGDAVVTVEDFNFEVSRRLEQGRPVSNAEDVLQDLILRQAMLQKASESGVLDDPIAKREIENQMLSQWLEQSLQAEKQNIRVTDEELSREYEENMASFSRPAMVRMAVLMRKVNPSDGEETIESLRAELVEAKERYLANPGEVTREGRLPGFGEIAVNATEDAVSRYRGGDMGWIQEGMSHSRIPSQVLQAGFSLEPGSVSDVIVVEDGLYVVLNSGRREAQVVPFEEAKTSLRRPLLRKKQDAVEHSFKSNLLASVAVDVNTAKVSELKIPEAVDPTPPNFNTVNSPIQKSISTP